MRRLTGQGNRLSSSRKGSSSQQLPLSRCSEQAGCCCCRGGARGVLLLGGRRLGPRPVLRPQLGSCAACAVVCRCSGHLSGLLAAVLLPRGSAGWQGVSGAGELAGAARHWQGVAGLAWGCLGLECGVRGVCVLLGVLHKHLGGCVGSGPDPRSAAPARHSICD